MWVFPAQGEKFSSFPRFFFKRGASTKISFPLCQGISISIGPVLAELTLTAEITRGSHDFACANSQPQDGVSRPSGLCFLALDVNMSIAGLRRCRLTRDVGGLPTKKHNLVRIQALSENGIPTAKGRWALLAPLSEEAMAVQAIPPFCGCRANRKSTRVGKREKFSISC